MILKHVRPKIYKVEITPEADFVEEESTKKVFVTDFFPREMDNVKISKKRKQSLVFKLKKQFAKEF